MMMLSTSGKPGFARISRRKRSRVGIPPSANDPARIVLNVSGRRFETDRWTLRTFADTRLAWMAINPSAHQEFDSGRGEFFIDRHAGCFEFILNFYRTGKLHMPTDVCGPLFEDELTYWGIDERLMEPCCWSRYKTYRDTEDRMRKMLNEAQQPYASTGSDDGGFSSSQEKANLGGGPGHEGDDEEDDDNNHAILHNIISFLDEQAYTAISLTMIGIYISVFCLETIDSFRVPKRPSSLSNDSYYASSSSHYYGGDISTTVPPLLYRSLTKPHVVLVILDYLCVAFFTLELILHIVVCPKPRQLFRSFLTWVDIITIIPLYFVIVFEAFADDESVFIELVKSVKILRILLIFKIANNFTGVRVLWYTFRASAKELLMLIFFLGIGVLFSGVLIYYAETMFGTRNSEFNSIPIGFWWGLVTMTTLGYGDFYPKTLPGYIVGASCAIIGVLVIALPIPVIVNNFTVYYAHAQALSSMPQRPKVVLAASAARRLQSVQSGDESGGSGSRSARTSLGITLFTQNYLQHHGGGGSRNINATTQRRQSASQQQLHLAATHRSHKLRGLLNKFSTSASNIVSADGALVEHENEDDVRMPSSASKAVSLNSVTRQQQQQEIPLLTLDPAVASPERPAPVAVSEETVEGLVLSTSQSQHLQHQAGHVEEKSSADEEDFDGPSSSLPTLSQESVEALTTPSESNLPSLQQLHNRRFHSTTGYREPHRSALSRQSLGGGSEKLQRDPRRLTFAAIPDTELDVELQQPQQQQQNKP